MYFMICSLTFMTWAKKAMKIVTYQETKMFLLCHHTKSHQGSSVASVRMWGICLIDFSDSLCIDCIERFWWDEGFYLIGLSIPTTLTNNSTGLWHGDVSIKVTIEFKTLYYQWYWCFVCLSGPFLVCPCLSWILWCFSH